MSQVFVVRMWLYCNSADIAALTAFDARWPGALQAQWATIVVAYNASGNPLQNLANYLNTLIQDKYGGANDWPAKDVTDFRSLDNPIKVKDWSVGAGGLHEGGGPMICQTASGPQQWSFTFGGSQPAFVFAACEWSLVNVA